MTSRPSSPESRDRQRPDRPPARPVLVCIDYEGRWGMPFRASYDIAASTHQILDVLDRHRIRAVFFVVGVLAVEHPDLVREISGRGHEIGLHGWRHEHLEGLSAKQLALFADGLAAAEAAIEAITGTVPTGFRAPYLLGPAFFDAPLYELLAGRGYRWTSNREIRHPIELLRPDLIRTEHPWRFARAHARRSGGLVTQALLVALNPGVYGHGGGSRAQSEWLRWLLRGAHPFYRYGMLEIPLYSPMDCDLLGLPRPSDPTPPAQLAFAQFALESCLARRGPASMLSFHDWIISGSTRLALLDALMACVAVNNLDPVTAEHAWARLSSVSERSTQSS